MHIFYVIYPRSIFDNRWLFKLLPIYLEHLPYRNEYHGEYQVLSKQRHDQRRRWNDLDDQQEKHVKTDENGNGERDL